MTAFAPIAATSLGQSSTSASYSMQVTSGTFAVSMQGAALLIGDIFPHGLFNYTGNAVNFNVGRLLSASTGSFALTGQNVNLDHGFGLPVDSGTFTYTGHSVAFDVSRGLTASNGSFVLTGQSLDFTKQMNVSAETGVFTYTGQDAFKGVGEAFEVGSFTYNGHNVDLNAQRSLKIDTGLFSYNLQDFKIKGWFSSPISSATWSETTSPDGTWTETTDTPSETWTDAP